MFFVFSHSQYGACIALELPERLSTIPIFKKKSLIIIKKNYRRLSEIYPRSVFSSFHWSPSAGKLSGGPGHPEESSEGHRVRISKIRDFSRFFRLNSMKVRIIVNLNHYFGRN